jgi:hypothetical protein
MSYDDLDYRSMIEEFEKSGELRLVLPKRHSNLCIALVENVEYFVGLISDPHKSRVRSLLRLAYNFWLQARVLLLHRKLVVVPAFFISSRPARWSVRSSGRGQTLFHFER